jgi:hypothetical protein
MKRKPPRVCGPRQTLDLSSLANLSREQFTAACLDLCERGLLTCMKGEPGADDARYAMTHLPLDNPERHSPAALERYAANRKKLGLT